MRYPVRSSLLRATLASLLFGMLASPQSTEAQARGFTISRLDISEVGSDWFVGDSLDLRTSRQPAVGLTLDIAKDPLATYDSQGNKQVAIIKRQALGHLQSRVVFDNRFRLAVDMPVLMHQSREIARVDGLLYKPSKGIRFGDLRVSGDALLFGKYGRPIVLAGGLELYLPTGSRAAFVGDGKVRVAPRLMVAGDLSAFAYSVRASFVYRPQHVGFGIVPTGSEIAWVATAGVRLLHRQLLLGPELFGSTGISKRSFLKYETTPLELLFGGHFFVGSARLGLAAGSGLTRGLGTPDYRILASVAYVTESNADRDGDGYYDFEDECPYVVGETEDPEERRGCPADRDHDGVADQFDACPTVAGIADRQFQRNGCPSDRDGDGVDDAVDACPYVFGVADKDPAKNGCAHDRDGDGVQDEVDACPDAAGMPSDDDKTRGCPLDRDGDGIPDSEDACPEMPGNCD